MMAFQAGGPHAQDRGLGGRRLCLRRNDQNSGKRCLGLSHKASTTRSSWKRPTVSFRAAWPSPSVVPLSPPGTAIPASLPVWRPESGNHQAASQRHFAACLSPSRSAERFLGKQDSTRTSSCWLSDEPGAEITKELVADPAVKIIDFTGSNAFGAWVRDNAGAAAQVYTEEPASIRSWSPPRTISAGCAPTIAFSLSLYSGQMCTAPQNIYVPNSGIETDDGHKSLDEVAEGIKDSRGQVVV